MQHSSLQSPNSFRTSAMGILLGLGFALYAYRFSLGDINITVLRIAALILGASLLSSVVQSRIRLSPDHWTLIFGVFLLVILNTFWNFSLEKYPIPQREMISHLANLILMLGLVIWLDTERHLFSVLNGYLAAAVIAIVIGYYGMIFREIPLEETLRTYGAMAAEKTNYINDDGDFLRLTGPFVDPNFFGIYLFTVFVFTLWLFHFCGQNKLYLLLALISLITLFLTMSRTSMVGLAVFFTAYLSWLQRKTRNLVLIASSIFLLLATVALFVFPVSFSERLLDLDSILERMQFISRGIEAFSDGPFFGSGPASIVDEASGVATAHLMYLSILAKFGLVGAIPYFVFIFYPLWFATRSELLLREYRFLVIGLYLPLFFMYFLYDFLYFLEFQYLIFAIGYSVVLSSYAKKQAV